MPNTSLNTALSEDESARLSALYEQGLLDTPPSPEFDALARLVAQSCQTPIAAIALLDHERLWLKAQVGLSLTEIPFSSSLANEAMQALGGVMCVPDLANDTRFSEHAIRQQWPEWHFYASSVIQNPEGQALGMCIAADTTVRQLDAAARQSLIDISHLAWCAIDAHAQRCTLARQAITDPLTGLANQSHFDQCLSVELAHSMRRGEPFTVLLLDLDGLSAINDGFGHTSGVEVLKEVANRIHAQVRVGDVVARFGIDQFGILMRHGDTADADALAKRIAKAVATPIALESGDTVGVGISVGMAAYDDSVESPKALIKRADSALFDAKRQNEKRWKMFMGIR